MRERKKVWIVEDDLFLRDSFTEIINSAEDFVVSGAFASGEDAIKQLSLEQPDFVLMDIELPGKNGVDCTFIIKQKYSNVQVVMVTVYEDSDLVFNSLKAGASGYITKSANFEQIIDSLQEIKLGGAPMSSKIAKMVIDSFHRSFDSPLSKREAEILRLVADGKTFTQISDQLFIARETTKTHVRNIYRKLEVNCRADAIAKANKNHLI
jgi:DNA-binding NarL/FixJ family response regulator